MPTRKPWLRVLYAVPLLIAFAAPQPSPKPLIKAPSAALKTSGSPRGPLSPAVYAARSEMLVRSSLEAQGVAPATDFGAIPSRLPADGIVTSAFGARPSPFTGEMGVHLGIDVGVKFGGPIYATADGMVAFAGWRDDHGREITIDHGYGIVTKYAHASRLVARAGQAVHRGDIIARAGSSGRSTGSHVHYEVLVKGRAVDPMRFVFAELPRTPEASSAHLAQMRFTPAPAPRGNGTVAFIQPLNHGERALYSNGLPWPDRRDQFGMNVSIMSVFTMLASVVVLCARRGERLVHSAARLRRRDSGRRSRRA